MARKPLRGVAEPVHQDQLAALLGTEARLAQRLDWAAAEALRITEQAQARAGEIESRLAAELAEADRVLATAVAADRERDIQAVRAAAARRREALRAVDEATINRLADWVVRRLVTGAGSTP